MEFNKYSKLEVDNFYRLLVQPQPKSLDDVKKIIMETSDIANNLPVEYSINPISGKIITYCPRRDSRPVDTQTNTQNKSCPICIGNTTPILFCEPKTDLEDHYINQEMAFTNLNKFPVMSPNPMRNKQTGRQDLYGYQFLIWPTVYHLPFNEINVENIDSTLRQIKKLESLIDPQKGENLLATRNLGTACGNSIEHEHFQVLISNFTPQRIREEEEFLNKNKCSFVQYTLENNNYLDLGKFNSISAITPNFARRGLETWLYPNDLSKSKFADLTNYESFDLSRAILKATREITNAMSLMNKPSSYNIVFHTGNIGTMYVEILPFVQAEGGLERAGLDVSQMSPEQTKEQLSNLSEQIEILNRCEFCGRNALQFVRREDRAFSIHYEDSTDYYTCNKCGGENLYVGYKGLA